MKNVENKLLLMLALLLFGVAKSFAVKANPLPVSVQQSDGSILTIVCHGDEDFHYVTTIDGVLITREGSDWMVAEVGVDGELRSSGLLAHDNSQRGFDELAVASRQDVMLFVQTNENNRKVNKARREPIAHKAGLFPHVGTPKAIVLLVEFSDVKFAVSDPKTTFNQYFNCMTTLQDFGNGDLSNNCSVRGYFNTVSFGQFAPEFDVYGPVTLDSPLKTYGGTKSGGKDEDMSLLFQNACEQIDDEIDFSQYDANDDEKVDLVFIIYAGYSESLVNNPPECIWPKSGTINGGTYDGKQVSRYGVSSELNGYEGCWSSAPYKRINGIGTFCHEFSHCLGLPDFYPTITSIKGDNQAMEYWSIMDSGNYLSNGYCPTAYTAWEREAMGWIDIPTLESSAQLSKIDLTPLDDGGCAYRIPNDNDPTGCEYLIVENIQQKGINKSQKGHGMLIYHVDYDPDIFSISSNSVNIEKGRPRMTVVPADNLLFAQYNIGREIDGKVIRSSDFYSQLAGDPFPGTSCKTECDDESALVNFAPYTGDMWNKAFQNINEHEDGTITFTYVHDVADNVKSVVTKDEDIPHRLYNLNGQSARQGHRGITVWNGRKVLKQ